MIALAVIGGLMGLLVLILFVWFWWATKDFDNREP
jgi:L-lactate permease